MVGKKRSKKSGLGHRFEAFHTDFYAFGSAVNYPLDGPQVRIVDAEIHIVGMGDSFPGLGMFSANFTGFRHISSKKTRFRF